MSKPSLWKWKPAILYFNFSRIGFRGWQLVLYRHRDHNPSLAFMVWGERWVMQIGDTMIDINGPIGGRR
jgi:hypothetical protein